MNKTSRDVIERIQRVCGTNMSDFRYAEHSLEDCLSTALHAYYFVKPGSATKRFMKKLAKSTIKGIKEGRELSNATGYATEVCVAGNLIPHIIKICRKSFDGRWFEYQINNMNDEVFNDKLLDKYVENFDKDQIGHLFQLIVNIGYKNHCFMSEHSCHVLWEEINRECQMLDNNLPIISSEYDDFPMFIFDCLNKEVLLKLLLKHIEKDKDIAGYVARLLYYFKPLVALEYIGVAMFYADLFGFRVFD